MNFLIELALPLKNMLDSLYAVLTAYFQNINLDDKLAFFCTNHLLVSSIIFILLLVYFIFFDKSKSYLSFTEPVNIVVVLIFIPIYTFLADRNINLDQLGLGSISIHSFILIVLGKLYGPLMTAAFGALEYILSYIASPNNPLMFSMLFIYAIGGLLHGWILYEKKTSFWRCFLSRFITILLCNIFLISFVRAGIYTHLVPISVFIPQTITSNIIQLPIQAVIGYISLLMLREIRKKLEF